MKEKQQNLLDSLLKSKEIYFNKMNSVMSGDEYVISFENSIIKIYIKKCEPESKINFGDFFTQTDGLLAGGVCMYIGLGEQVNSLNEENPIISNAFFFIVENKFRWISKKTGGVVCSTNLIGFVPIPKEI